MLQQRPLKSCSGICCRSSIALLVIASLLTGCGAGEPFQRAAVSGYVSLDGAPLKSGSIRFIPQGDNHGPAVVARIDEGLYQLSRDAGPLTGPHRVEIVGDNVLAFPLDDEQAYSQHAERGQVHLHDPLPPAFHRDSQLSVVIVSGEDNEHDFRLTSSGVLATSQ